MLERQVLPDPAPLTGVIDVLVEVNLVGVAPGDLERGVGAAAVHDMDVGAPAVDAPQASLDVGALVEGHDDGGQR